MLMLEDEDLWVRCAALRGLGVCGDASRVDAVRRSLASADGVVLITGLEALLALEGEAASADLIRALGREDPEVIRAALTGLERVGTAGDQNVLAQALCRLLGHADSDVRLMVARFAAIHRVRETLSALIARRETEGDQAVHEMLRYAIERIGGPGTGQGRKIG
jgi:HEAT repeat protein